MDAPGLGLEDHLALRRLKYLRQRSMRNEAWRGATQLGLVIQRDPLHWAEASPLESHRRRVEQALTAYKLAATSRAAVADLRWAEVRSSVDDLIAKAENLAGRRIKPRRL